MRQHLLEIEFEYKGQRQTIWPVLLQDERDTILVDCGYPDFLPLLAEAAGRHGAALESATKLILTHHDMDHIGSLGALKRAYPQLEVICHRMERPYIEGRYKSLRQEQAEATLDTLPEEARPHALEFIRLLESVEPAPVDRTVRSGEQLPWCGGIEIVHTPGHMPGHISLYLPSTRTLIAGDAVVLEEGRLGIANPHYTLNMEEALRSVQRLLEYEIDTLICYHGGALRGGVREALEELLRTGSTL